MRLERSSSFIYINEPISSSASFHPINHIQTSIRPENQPGRVKKNTPNHFSHTSSKTSSSPSSIFFQQTQKTTMEVTTMATHFFPPTATSNRTLKLSSSVKCSSLSTSFVSPYIGTGGVTSDFSGQKIRPVSLNPTSRKRVGVTMVTYPFHKNSYFVVFVCYFDILCFLWIKILFLGVFIV